MNNNKISNPKTEVEQTSKMNDKDYITTILCVEKAIVKDYATSLTEASNNSLYDDYFDMFEDVSRLQRQIYNLMCKKGWYCLETAQEDKINQKLNMLEQEFPQLEINE